MRSWKCLGFLLFGMSLWSMGSVGCGVATGGGVCKYAGKDYAEGAKFPASDGCNTCTCDAKGVSCTEKACLPNACTYLGKSYKEGDTFSAGDGCNTCTCQNGKAMCTLLACTKDCLYKNKIYKEGSTFAAEDGCNSCTCSGGGVACTNKTCEGKSCGGEAGITCPEGQYCKIDKGCGFDDGSGVCMPKPQGCNNVYQPVCGCDGKTYSNICEAAKAGTSVLNQGECKSAPTSCLYAGQHYKDGESFPAEDGCNTCMCSSGRVRCSETDCAGKSCGGLVPPGVDNSCPTGQYCHFSIKAMCGAADHPGVCAVKPQGCGRVYNPVCGCDGKTYSNPCEASMAGTSTYQEGACKAP